MYHSVKFNVRDPIHSPGLKFPEADLFNIARYLSKTCKSHPDGHLCNIIASTRSGSITNGKLNISSLVGYALAKHAVGSCHPNLRGCCIRNLL